MIHSISFPSDHLVLPPLYSPLLPSLSLFPFINMWTQIRQLKKLKWSLRPQLKRASWHWKEVQQPMLLAQMLQKSYGRYLPLLFPSPPYAFSFPSHFNITHSILRAFWASLPPKCLLSDWPPDSPWPSSTSFKSMDKVNPIHITFKSSWCILLIFNISWGSCR